MPSDYKAIRAKNQERFGTEVEQVARKFVVNGYADPAHFVFELLQNTEDALHRRCDGEGRGTVRFTLTGDELRISHFGLPFTKEDVLSICDLTSSTKEGDLTVIGRFGIGFKSVYRVADEPCVHSGDEHFAIAKFVQPHALPPINLAEGETIIRLPFKPDAPTDRIVGQLKRLGRTRTLLFLREITQIEWHTDDGQKGVYSREDAQLEEWVRRVTLRSDAQGSDPTEESWLVFSRPVSHQSRPAGQVELAYKVVWNEAGQEVIEPVETSDLVVFFPTTVRTDLGMLVQGPYRTTLTRENIAEQDSWNQYLVEETARLLVDTLRYLRDHTMLGVHVFEALPLSRSRFADADEPHHFAPLFEAVRDAIANEPLLPAHKGKPIPASRAWFTNHAGIRNHFGRKQLSALVDAEGAAWLSGDINQSNAKALYDHLRTEHSVEVIGLRRVFDDHGDYALTQEFLEDQTDWWVQQLYGLLSKGRLSRADVSSIPIIRLEDGTHVSAYEDLFLPTLPPSGFPNTVRPEVCRTKPAREFLEFLRIREPDLIDEAIREVIPKYRDAEPMVASTYDRDLTLIVTRYAAAEREGRDRLVAALRDMRFVRAVDAATGEESLAMPEDVYLSTERMTTLFEGVRGVLLTSPPPKGVDPQEINALLRACGVAQRLKAIQQDGMARFPPKRRAAIRRMAGYPKSTRTERVHDSQFLGLESLLKHLSTLQPMDSHRRSRQVWDELCHAEDQAPRRGFSATYQWFYSTVRKRAVEAASVELLRRVPWVPEANGELKTPGEVVFENLRWPSNPFLQGLLGFPAAPPPSRVAALAKEADVDESALLVVKELGLTGPQIRELYESQQRSQPQGPAKVDGATATSLRAAPKTTNGAPGVTTPASPPSGSKPGGGARSEFKSYIAVGHESEDDGEGSEERERRLALEEAAIEVIQRAEPALERTGTNNPGFDLYEADASGEPVRWVEVKATRHTWDVRPVTLSHTQFEYAREKGDAYSLYVVERAGSDEPNIIRIQNPAGLARTYTLDEGWCSVAEPSP